MTCGKPSKLSATSCSCGESFEIKLSSVKVETPKSPKQEAVKPKVKKSLSLEELKELDDIPYDYVGEFDFSALSSAVEESINKHYKK